MHGCHRMYFLSSNHFNLKENFVREYFNFCKWAAFSYSLTEADKPLAVDLISKATGSRSGAIFP